ncbi:MAG: hypothetical protein WBG70_10965 [Spirulinaceae cyanobacterium]
MVLEKLKVLLTQTTPQTPEPELSLQELSPQTKEKLSCKLAELRPPQTYTEALKEALNSAIARWQDEPNAPNSLVILASAGEPLESILEEVLLSKKNPSSLSQRWLLSSPSCQVQKRIQQLKAELKEVPERQLVILPRLSQSFLRCIGSLEIINKLGEAVFNHPDSFWLIGCHSWAWQYLIQAKGIQGRFCQTFPLPKLSGEAIKAWLEPVRASMEITQDEEQEYFENLAEISSGLSQVAGELWLRSLGHEKELEKETSPLSLIPLIQQQALLPKLPKLAMSDRYLLYSLALHEQLTIPDLATSLGENSSDILISIQRLQQEGLLQRYQEYFVINPIYYSQLRRDLEQNNFLVEE